MPLCPCHSQLPAPPTNQAGGSPSMGFVGGQRVVLSRGRPCIDLAVGKFWSETWGKVPYMYIGAFPKSGNGGTTCSPRGPLTWSPQPSPKALIVFSLPDSSLSIQEAPVPSPPTVPTSAQLADFSKSPNCPGNMHLGLSHASPALPPPVSGPHPAKCFPTTPYLNSLIHFNLEP